MPQQYPIIRDSIENDVEKNVFLIKDSNIGEDFYVEDLEVENHFLCLKNTGKLELWLKGQGKTALLYTR